MFFYKHIVPMGLKKVSAIENFLKLTPMGSIILTQVATYHLLE